ncbi:interleukin-23 subunit alpha [Thamnophis elegans]|uniref:interleukin-23 subunit alpha n=1 Tax=Thamnophis elegans TaxID=35005 RepID=UPI0013788EB5|nr:interleukin-23 subunit alpha [Thamnophis elegans]
MPCTSLSQSDCSQAICALTPANTCHSTITPFGLLLHCGCEQADEVGQWPRGLLLHMAVVSNKVLQHHFNFSLKSSEMMLNAGHPLQSSLFYLLLLFTASRGMRLPRESDIDWQGCKTASQDILKHLQKLNVTKVEKRINISLPRQIECNDHCDPDSLSKNSTLCLMKIRRGLHRYQELLTQYAKSDTTTGLRTAVTNLLKLLREDESNSPAKQLQEWEKSHVADVILQRLQLFAILVARVFSHCATLNRDVTI